MIQWVASRLKELRRQFLETVLPSLSRESVEATLAGFRSRDRVYTAWALFQTFLAQVVAGDACRAAIERAIQQQWVPLQTSNKTGAYCNARSALPERGLRELALGHGRALHRHVPPSKACGGRPVKVFDGSSVQLPDTPANQQLYPQPKAQKPGCGFPVMYLMAAMSLTAGAILDVVIGQQGKEHPMFRWLWRCLCGGDIALVDAGLVSYAEIAMLVKRGVDFVGRLGHQRKLDWPAAQPLGPGQWLVRWMRPKDPVDWVAWEALPPTLTLRLIQFHTQIKGFRSHEITLVTTLLDTQQYPVAELIDLYARRWEMELRLRDIKSTMGLDKLSCLTPRGCRKELWMGLLAYNLIRAVMVDAARRGHLPLHRISFAGTMQRLREFGYGGLLLQSPQKAYLLLLDHLIDDRLVHRPGRVEPRKLKRRPARYTLMTQPRHIERLRLLEA